MDIGPHSSSIRSLIFWGIEGGLLLAWCRYGMALLVLLKAADIFMVVVEVGHRLCKCGVFLYGRGGKFWLECWGLTRS